MGKKRKKVAIFGGSFDPIHFGHLRMAEQAHQQFDFDQILFMPCFRSPFKDGTHANGVQRWEMLRIAINTLDWQNWADVSGYEATREEPSYSWQTAQHLSEKNPDTEYHWLLGTDQWEQIENWAEPEKLRQLLSFVVVTRNNTEVRERDGWRFQSMDFDHPASSTQLRSDFSLAEEWMPKAVRDYCRAESLYQSS